MKIGILTLRLHTNYGGIVQAYALQTVLERMGHDVKVINKRMKQVKFSLPRWKKPLAYGKRLLVKVLIDHNEVIKKEELWTREYALVSRYTNEFIARYIHSYYVETVDDVRPDDFDAIVVGSDQIWREIYDKRGFLADNNANRFLAFADGWDIKRYVYAASFGVDYWQFNPDETRQMARLAKQFLAVSVREDSAVTLCKQYLGIDAVHLIDPTMLLTSADYSILVEAANMPASEGDLFCYILDSSEEKTALIERIAEERGMRPFYVRNKNLREKCNIEERCVPSVEKWLRAFMDAKFVVTDSFHGMAFSINFGKPFIAIGNEERGMARMSSIARMFGMEDHLLTGTADYDPDKSYDVAPETRNILEEQRQRSRDFLSRIK